MLPNAITPCGVLGFQASNYGLESACQTINNNALQERF